MWGHAFNLSTWKAEVEAGRLFCEAEASLVYTESSRKAQTTQRDPISKKKKIVTRVYR